MALLIGLPGLSPTGTLMVKATWAVIDMIVGLLSSALDMSVFWPSTTPHCWCKTVTFAFLELKDMEFPSCRRLPKVELPWWSSSIPTTCRSKAWIRLGCHSLYGDIVCLCAFLHIRPKPSTKIHLKLLFCSQSDKQLPQATPMPGMWQTITDPETMAPSAPLGRLLNDQHLNLQNEKEMMLPRWEKEMPTLFFLGGGSSAEADACWSFC